MVTVYILGAFYNQSTNTLDTAWTLLAFIYAVRYYAAADMMTSTTREVDLDCQYNGTSRPLNPSSFHTRT